MEPRTLLVTYDADADRRRAIEGALPPAVEATYLEDLAAADHPAAVADADAILTFAPSRELDAAAFDAIHDGQVVQLVSAGVDHLPLSRFPDGVRLCSNAGAYAEPMAEHVLALYLALAKRLHEEHRRLEAGEWHQFEPNLEVAGSDVAIVGFGAVGRASARRFQALDADVLAINRSGESPMDTAFLGTPEAIEPVLRQADGLVLSAPLTAATRGLVDAEALGWLGDDAILVNVGRGELVDQGDLYAHLEANPEFRAGIDAWWTEPMRDGAFELEHPLLELPNVLGSPHNSAQVPGVRERGQRLAVENVVAALGDGEPANVVDRERGY